ncbi:hypothetical protein QQS21_005976 [Conoideocrella luteorostrata]|uniref:Thioesterase domain-containing protein n=1 Tax=Conoideocrella luteorostrata TaxID=1105319 RepID=A0AAJ0CRF1_9HYPO|nr:hypothetical protein QQS21_005976 [Conoideocrella luteorostrata]
MQRNEVEVVQDEDWQCPGRSSGLVTPIFLIHDGGGTTFAYHCLEPLNRLIHGIRNPHFRSGKRFEGGLAEMGDLYTRWIRETVASPTFPRRNGKDGRIDILVGGWSLGGMLSLEVARCLADDRNINVCGILMIDSVYPCAAKQLANSQTISEPPEEGLTKNQILAQRCMTQARRMVGEWQVPVWNGPFAGKRPRAVLLRATGYVPTEGNTVPGLDKHRKDKMLGWGEYDANMFDAVFDVEGHHFDLFAYSRVEETTAVVARALEKLDSVVEKSTMKGDCRGIKSFWSPIMT